MSAAAPRGRIAPGPATRAGKPWLARWRPGPFALAVHGFVIGCILFAALRPAESEPVRANPGGGSVLSTLKV